MSWATGASNLRVFTILRLVLYEQLSGTCKEKTLNVKHSFIILRLWKWWHAYTFQNPSPSKSLLSRRSCRRRGAVGGLISNNGASNSSSTRSIRAVSNTVIKVDIFAKTCRIRRAAAKGWILSDQIVKTCLATRRQSRNSCRGRGCGRAASC
jgi:hypothetical protein